MLRVMMNTRTWWWIIVALFAVIVGMMVLLFVMPAPRRAAEVPVATTTPNVPVVVAAPDISVTEPLSAKVAVMTPKPDAHVGHTFDIEGKAPGGWFNEAQFPMQVRDKDENVIGRARGGAQGEWMTEKLVVFKATMHIEETYHGPATLILLKDNPSGLPEIDDSTSIQLDMD